MGPFLQLSAFARTLAVDVFPTPRGPEKIYAWATLFFLIAFFNILVMLSCPIMSSKIFGLHFLARTVYSIVLSFLLLCGCAPFIDSRHDLSPTGSRSG